MVRETGSEYKREVIEPGDHISRLAKDINIESFHNCPSLAIVPHEPGNFRGAVGYAWRPWIAELIARTKFDDEGNVVDWKVLEQIENDGAGGKPVFHSLVGTPEVFSRLGWEIIEMTAGDLARTGRFPALMINQIDFKNLTPENMHLAEAAIRGYGEALKEARLVNLTGETAVMKYTITSAFDLNSPGQLCVSWSGACIGLAAKELLLDPLNHVGPEMPIVGFWEPGYRCNGGGKLTKLMLQKWGPTAEDVAGSREAIAFATKLCTPSFPYSRTIVRLTGWSNPGSVGMPEARIMGVAHITGGGLPGKLSAIFPEGIGACLTNMPIPAEVLLEAQDLCLSSGIECSDEEMHTTFHGGCGMMVVCKTHRDADIVIAEAAKDGIRASYVGRTIQENDDNKNIAVASRFLRKNGQLLYLPRG